MSKEFFGAAALLLMATGELLAIYAELLAARLAQDAGQSLTPLWLPLLLISIAGICLVLAYWTGYRALGDIWLVSVLSIVLLLLMEPLIIWLMFAELPKRGAALGFLFGALGLAAAVIL